MRSTEGLQLSLTPSEREDESVMDGLQRNLRYVAEAVTAILDNLPVQRRPLSDSVKSLHVRVVWERRNGWCPTCEAVRIADANGKLPCAEFDHWYGRHRNRAEETWMICENYNSSLERPELKQAASSAFEAYQTALRLYLDAAQRTLQ